MFFQVGGDFTDAVIAQHMKFNGRVVIIGGMAGYNEKEPSKGTAGEGRREGNSG